MPKNLQTGFRDKINFLDISFGNVDANYATPFNCVAHVTIGKALT